MLVGRRIPARLRVGPLLATALVLASSASAVAGWAWAPGARRVQPRWIAIRDVRPLHTDDANLRDLISHTYAVHVSIAGWRLLPYRPGATTAANRAGAGHWRLYLDGRSLGDQYGPSTVSYTTYLPPGTHWIAAELSNADGTSLSPSVWSEPVVLYVPHGAIPHSAGTVAAATAASGKEKP